MSALPTPSSTYSEIINLLKSKHTAIRTESDLKLILHAIDSNLTAADPVWASLSIRQKLVLCKYFESRTVFDEDGLFLPCVERTGMKCPKFKHKPQYAPNESAEKDGDYSGGLFLLLRGKATVTIGEYSIVIHEGINECCHLRAVMGRLVIPPDSKEFFKSKNAKLVENQNIYRRFVSLEDRHGEDVSLRIDKGSTYLVLPESKSRVFLERLNASLVTRRVFNDIGLVKLLDRQVQLASDRKCNFDVQTQQISTKKEGGQIPRIFRFRPGQILMREGEFRSRVFFIAKGSCLIFKNGIKGELPSCVGSMCSPSFVGISEIFQHCTASEINGNGQLVSVVTVTEGYAYSFCSKEFFQSVARVGVETGKESQRPSLLNSFKVLAESQLKVWCARNDTKPEDECRTEGKSTDRKGHELGKETEQPDEPASQNDGKQSTEPKPDSRNTDASNQLFISGSAVQQKKPDKKSSGIAVEPVFENVSEEDERNLNILVKMNASLSSGKLKKTKFLEAIHKSFSSGASEPLNAKQIEMQNDLLEHVNNDLLADIMAALSIGKGIHHMKCEASDPFHNFSAKKNSQVDSDLQMLLQFPLPLPNRLDSMADNCLGRKRPPEYDGSDPFLSPVPSVVSRKMHGSTLPIVRQSKGCIDPLAYKEEEWVV